MNVALYSSMPLLITARVTSLRQQKSLIYISDFNVRHQLKAASAKVTSAIK
jgi:hypothetical protein